MPARAVDTDPDLSRECAVCDLSINRGAREAGASQHCLQSDDAFWVRHGVSFDLSVMAPLVGTYSEHTVIAQEANCLVDELPSCVVIEYWTDANDRRSCRTDWSAIAEVAR